MEKTQLVKTYLPPRDVETLRARAAMGGLSLSAYCRAVLTGAAPEDMVSADVTRLLREMKRAGYAVSCILDALGPDSPDAPALRAAVAEVHEAVKAVMRAYAPAGR